MKKAIFILSVIAVIAVGCGCGGNEVKAQGVVTGTMHTSISSSVDSIRCISTTPNYLYVAPSLAYQCASFVATITRISAAIGGTIFLQASNDNSNWFTWTHAAGDTITVADAASQVKSIVLKPTAGLPYKYYRLKCTGASSDTMTVRATFTGRQ